MTSEGSRFIVNHNETLNDNEMLDEDDDDIFPDMKQSPWTDSFDVMKLKMQKIPNFPIYKRIVHKGENEVVGTQHVRATYHYTAFLEKDTESFDSTYARGRPDATIMYNSDGYHDLLPGLFLALQTMKKDEEAEFIIGYEFLYGEMGCPPRIPEKADCLFIIKLLSFHETGDQAALDLLTSEDRNRFSVVSAKAEHLYKKGSESFKMNRLYLANSEFAKAINALEFCTMNSDEESKLQQDFLIKLYRNQALCFNKRQMWKKTCLMCNELVQLSKKSDDYEINNDCKALFHWGRAMMGLNEFKKAREYLKRAQQIEPHNKDVTKEWCELDKKEKYANKVEMEIAQRAMGLINLGNNAKQEDDLVYSRFKNVMKEAFEEFKAGQNSKFTVPDNLDRKEIDLVKKLAIDFGLLFQQNHVQNGVVKYIISKNE